jgi:pSer/pThr/pTyr-binding forkhead associated (FHA) protein
MIPDAPPWQISRHHACFVQHHGRIGVVDWGSTLGLSVDGQRLGGAEGSPGPLFFSGPEGTLVLGHQGSPFQFRVVIIPWSDE